MSLALLNATGLYPQLAVLADFTNATIAPPSAPAWTDITDKVRELTIKPTYRQNALDRFETGTLSMILDNNERDFDPTYAASPFFPYVRPMTRFQVQATWSGVTYFLCTGYLDSAPQEWPSFGTDALVKVGCSDLFKVLNLADLSMEGNVPLKGKYVTGSSGGYTDIAAGDTTIWLNSWPAAWPDPQALPSPFYILIDSEWMLVTATGGTVDVSTGLPTHSPATRSDQPVALTVTRAQNGTTAVAHTAGAGVSRAGLPAASTGNRIKDVLSAAKLDGLESVTIDTGISTCVKVSASDLANVEALDHIFDVVDTEFGVIYTDGTGKLVFHDRHDRSLNRVTPLYTFGDGPGELGYEDITAPYDDERLWNKANVTASDTNSTVESWVNDASVEQNAPRTLERTVLTSDLNDAQNAAQYIAYKYGDPEQRFDQIVIQPASDPANLWPAALGLKISDRVTVKRRPKVGSAISLDCYLEAMPQHDITPDGWKTTLSLSEASKDTFWILGDSTYGVLGSTTKPGF